MSGEAAGPARRHGPAVCGGPAAVFGGRAGAGAAAAAGPRWEDVCRHGTPPTVAAGTYRLLAAVVTTAFVLLPAAGASAEELNRRPEGKDLEKKQGELQDALVCGPGSGYAPARTSPGKGRCALEPGRMGTATADARRQGRRLAAAARPAEVASYPGGQCRSRQGLVRRPLPPQPPSADEPAQCGPPPPPPRRGGGALESPIRRKPMRAVEVRPCPPV